MSGLLKLFIAGLIAASVAGVIYHYSSRIADWFRFQSLGTRDYLVERLNLMFIEIPPDRVLLSMFGASILGFVIGFVLFIPTWPASFLFGTVLAGVMWKVPRPLVDYLVRKRTEKFVGQMVDALSLLSNGLKSGLSINQAMGLVAQEMPNPTQEEFNLVLSENKLGVSLEDAFTNLANRLKSDDVEMFVTAINILKETGGNLAETFDTITYTLRERIKAEGKISSMTAAGFYQGMVMFSLPPGLMVILYFQDPAMMAPLFSKPLGWAMLLGIAVLMGVGLVVTLAVVKVDV